MSLVLVLIGLGTHADLRDGIMQKIIIICQNMSYYKWKDFLKIWINFHLFCPIKQIIIFLFQEIILLTCFLLLYYV